MIVGVAVVPTTPLLLPGLPGRPHPEMAAMGAAARRAAEGLARAQVVIALAAGPELAVSNPPDPDLTGYGLTDLPGHDVLPAQAGIVEALGRVAGGAAAGGAAAGGASVAGTQGPDLAVLVRYAPAGAACVGVGVPADTATEPARALGEAIIDLAAGTAVGVLVAGDLSAGHGPKPPRPEAAALADTVDGIVIAALDGGRPADLVRLDPALAASSAARAVGALRVLGTVLGGARIGTVVRATGAPLGVGYVVAQGG